MGYGDKIKLLLSQVESKQKGLPYLELDSMMLSQVVDVAKRVSQNDINSTHVQNWVRRKYLPNPVKKKYSREQVANILLMNDLRNILSLEQITQLLAFVNKNPLDTSDDRINPVELYRYYSQIFDNARLDWEKSLQGLENQVEHTLKGEDLGPEDKGDVAETLIILNLLARANLYKQIAETFLAGIRLEAKEGERGKEE